MEETFRQKKGPRLLIDILCAGCGFSLSATPGVSKWGNPSIEVEPCAICQMRFHENKSEEEKRPETQYGPGRSWMPK